MNVPDQLYAGDTLEFRVSVADFPPSEGWSLKYRFTPRFTAPAQAPITLVATVDGDEFVLFQSPAQTALWAPGAYNWARWVEKTGARQVLDDLDSRGQLDVKPDPSQTAQGADNRTQAQKALDDCNAALANVATRALNAGTSGIPVEYRIADRMMKYQTADEAHAALLTVRNHWAAVVREETRREVIARKGFDPNRVLVRF